MTLLIPVLFAATVQVAATAPPQKPSDRTTETLTGCIQQTGDPKVFLLAVPGIAPAQGSGTAGGAREATPNAGHGSATQPNVGSTERRAATTGNTVTAPALQHRSYKLLDLDPQQMKPLIGRAVEVTGEVLPATGSTPDSTIRAKKIKQVGESCVTLQAK
jgi:hypothetical protein